MKYILLAWVMLMSVCGYAQTAEDLYEQARSNFNDKNYTDAIRIFDKSLDENPEYLPSLYYRAMANYRLKKYKYAIADFSKVIELDPTMAEAYYYRAMCKEAKGNKDEAYIDYESATILDNTNADYFFKKAQLAQHQNQNIEAVIAFSKAAMFNPQNEEAVSARRKMFQKLSKDELANLSELAPEITSASGKEIKRAIDDPKTIETRQKIQNTSLDIETAQRMYRQIQYGKGFNPGKKVILLKELRIKTLKDVYGKNPYKEGILEMKNTLNQNSWLRPDGMNYYFELIKNSKYWFTYGIQRKSIYYYYNVTRSKKKSYYQVKMYAVKNKASNVVFSTKVRIYEDSLSRVIKIFDSYNAGYRWKTSKTEYLSATTNLKPVHHIDTLTAVDSANTRILKIKHADNSPKTTFNITSKMGLKKDTQHGVSQASYRNYITPKDESENAVIRAALNRLILDYPRVFLTK